MARELAEKDFSQREARELAGVLGDIQEVIAAVAGAKGLDYVVKVSPGPQPDATPSDVHSAVDRSVLYANPRNDITKEVSKRLLYSHKDLEGIYNALKTAMDKAAKPPQQPSGAATTPGGMRGNLVRRHRR